MPEPIALCIENLDDEADNTRFIRCVALPGNRAGLGIDAGGRPLWAGEREPACELWVSGDERLMLLRLRGAPEVLVRRTGRSLAAPVNKPVVLLDQDELVVGGATLRLHVHGPTAEIHAPMPFVSRSVAAAALATAVALGTGAIGCEGGGAAVQGVSPVPTEQVGATASGAQAASSTIAATTAATSAPSVSAVATGTTAASGTAPSKPSATASPPIEVRTHPPKMMAPTSMP